MKAFVTVGLPASGKSTWAAGMGYFEVNLDRCREVVSGDASNQTATPAAVFGRDFLLGYLARQGTDVVVSDTNLYPADRERLIRNLRRLGYEVTLVLFDVPLETCLERNRSRRPMVPESVMIAMDRRLRDNPVAFGEADQYLAL